MSEQIFDAYVNQWERNDGAPITEQEIGQDLAELERQGYGNIQFTPSRPIFARTFTEEELDQIASADDDAPDPALMRVSFTDRLLRAVDELGATTQEYGEALDLHAAAVVDAFESEATLAYAELDFRAKLLAQGVPGSNEPTRKINLDLAVMDAEALSELRVDADKCRHAKTHAETTVRKLDQRQKALRGQIAGLTALLTH